MVTSGSLPASETQRKFVVYEVILKYNIDMVPVSRNSVVSECRKVASHKPTIQYTAVNTVEMHVVMPKKNTKQKDKKGLRLHHLRTYSSTPIQFPQKGQKRLVIIHY